MSLGGGASPGMQIAMQYAINKGVVVLAAAGNNGDDRQRARVSGRVPRGDRGRRVRREPHAGARSRTPAATSTSAHRATASCRRGRRRRRSYAVASGTSMATPYASAEAALIISENHTLSVVRGDVDPRVTARDAGAAGRRSGLRARADRPRRGGARGDAADRRATARRATGTGSSGRREACARTGRPSSTAASSARRDPRRSPRRARRAATATGSSSANGAVFAFGDARFYGGVNGLALHAPIVGMAATPSGRGYILLGADGGIFTFGDAHFYGSTGGMHLNARVLDLAMTASGHGYWFVAADGGVFSFGDAHFHGSTGAHAPRRAGDVDRELDRRPRLLAGRVRRRHLRVRRAVRGQPARPPQSESAVRTRRRCACGRSRRTTATTSSGSTARSPSFGTARFFGSASPAGSVDLMLAP